MDAKEKRICRVCSVEKKIKRQNTWATVGICPECKERHALFARKEK